MFERPVDGSGVRSRIGDVGERKARESMSKKKHERPPDRVISSVADRRPAILDVIRQARRQVTLSLFR